MTEQHTAAILIELRRIGVELDLASAPLVATGFTQRSLLAWLQQVPSGAGREALDRRLHDHAIDALTTRERAGTPPEDDASSVDRLDARDHWRWWPSTVMLDAGIEVFAEEWDPVGLRAGSVPAEDIGEYAFRFFAPLLHPSPNGDSLTYVAEMIASVEEEELGVRRSPELHRRYLASRLREIVSRFPLPEGPPRPPKTVALTGDDTETGPPPPKAPRSAHERIPFLDGSTEPPMSAESRSWDDTVDFLRVVLTARNDPDRGAEITPAMLAELASEIAADAHKMNGPMPPEVDLFVREHAPAA